MFGGTAQHPLCDDGVICFLDLPQSQVSPYPPFCVNLGWILVFNFSYTPVFRETLAVLTVDDAEQGGKCLQQEPCGRLILECRSFPPWCGDQVKGGNTELEDTYTWARTGLCVQVFSIWNSSQCIYSVSNGKHTSTEEGFYTVYLHLEAAVVRYNKEV